MSELNNDTLFDNDDFDVDFGDESEILGEKETTLNPDKNSIGEEAKATEPKVDITKKEDKADKISNDTATNKSDSKDKFDENSYVLYIVSDKNYIGTINYFRSFGINVSNIFSKLEDVRDCMLMQVAKSRLVVIDTGTGKFTNVTARKVLIDTIGIADEESKVAIFYTDSAMKSEIDSSIELKDKKIDWFKYKTTADTAANILMLAKKENYVYDNEAADDKMLQFEDLSKLKGKLVKDPIKSDIGGLLITPQLIMANLDGDIQHQIPGYEIRY